MCLFFLAGRGGLACDFLISCATVNFNLSTHFTFNGSATQSIVESVLPIMLHLVSSLSLVGLNPLSSFFFKEAMIKSLLKQFL